MIIRAAYQNARLLHADFLHQLEIFLAGTYPTRDLRILIPLFHTLIYRVPILFTVQKELAGTDHTVWSTQLVQIIIDCDDLLRCIGRSGLLTVPKRGIRNPNILRHIMRHCPVVKRNLRYFGIRKHIPEHIRFLNIVQNIHMLFYFQKIIMIIHGYRTIRKSSLIIHNCHVPFRVYPLRSIHLSLILYCRMDVRHV